MFTPFRIRSAKHYNRPMQELVVITTKFPAELCLCSITLLSNVFDVFTLFRIKNVAMSCMYGGILLVVR